MWLEQRNRDGEIRRGRASADGSEAGGAGMPDLAMLYGTR